jgi:hypothetical protein
MNASNAAFELSEPDGSEKSAREGRERNIRLSRSAAQATVFLLATKHFLVIC